jgi:hypothetical protein
VAEQRRRAGATSARVEKAKTATREADVDTPRPREREGSLLFAWRGLGSASSDVTGAVLLPSQRPFALLAEVPECCSFGPNGRVRMNLNAKVDCVTVIQKILTMERSKLYS